FSLIELSVIRWAGTLTPGPLWSEDQRSAVCAILADLRLHDGLIGRVAHGPPRTIAQRLPLLVEPLRLREHRPAQTSPALGGGLGECVAIHHDRTFQERTRPADRSNKKNITGLLIRSQAGAVRQFEFGMRLGPVTRKKGQGRSPDPPVQ